MPTTIKLRYIISLVLILLSPLIISLSIIGLYFKSFPDSLSDKQEVWGQFGDLVGGILNPSLSFYALVAAIGAIAFQMVEGKRSRSNALYQIFESTFFKIMEIHGKKVEMMQFEERSGPSAFVQLTREFSSILYENVKDEYLSKAPGDFEIIIDQWLENQQDNFSNYGQECIKQVQSKGAKTKFEVVKEVLEKYGIPPAEFIFANVDQQLRQRAITSYASSLNANEFNSLLSQSCDNHYAKYGNLYGHYFRNISMMLDHLASAEFGMASKFGKLFRAQLSRSEIAMLLVNCVGNQTSNKFNGQVKTFQLIDGFEIGDIFMGKRILDIFNLSK
jgi:Putative phage abortive infection protein